MSKKPRPCFMVRTVLGPEETQNYRRKPRFVRLLFWATSIHFRGLAQVSLWGKWITGPACDIGRGCRGDEPTPL